MATRAWGWDSRSCRAAQAPRTVGTLVPFFYHRLELLWPPERIGLSKAGGHRATLPLPLQPLCEAALSSFVWKRGAVGEISPVFPPPAASGATFGRGLPSAGEHCVLTLPFYLRQSPESWETVWWVKASQPTRGRQKRYSTLSCLELP